MFKVSGKEIIELQIKAVEKEALEILTDNEYNLISRSETFRQCLQMKEKVSRFILEELKTVIERYINNGVSSVSLFGIAEAFQKALESSTAQMQVFASELAKLTRNGDIEKGYSYIAERLLSEAEALIEPLKEKNNKAVSDVSIMVFAEIYDTWNNLKEQTI